jgi:exocyst complex component 4
MLESIRVKQIFSFDEYRTMLNLQCGVNQAEGEAGKAKATDRSYSIYILDLLQMENAKEEEDS